MFCERKWGSRGVVSWEIGLPIWDSCMCIFVSSPYYIRPERVHLSAHALLIFTRLLFQLISIPSLNMESDQSIEAIQSAIRPLSAMTLAIGIGLLSLSQKTTPLYLRITVFSLVAFAFYYVDEISPYYVVNDYFARFIFIVSLTFLHNRALSARLIFDLHSGQHTCSMCFLLLQRHAKDG